MGQVAEVGGEGRGADVTRSTNIHATAEVDPSAEVGAGTEVGPFCVVGPEVSIGDDCRLKSHVVISGQTTLGRACRVHPFAVLGTAPQDRKYREETTALIIGDEVEVREHATIHRGTVHGDRKTLIGDRTLLMAYCHVAHDCHVGNDVVMTNGSTLAGHVVVEDFAVLGGFAAVGQMLRIGESAMLAAGAMVERDAPPFCITAGDRARVRAVNTVGLRRRGLDHVTISHIKTAFRILFRSGGKPLREAITEVRDTVPTTEHIDHLLKFLEASRKGISR